MAVEMDEATKAKILKQVDFYFGDSNLPKDNFLKKQIAAHPEGWVDLSVVVAFARMKTLLKLAEDVKPESVEDKVVTAVADILRTSSVVDVSEDGFQVKRKTAVPDASEMQPIIDGRSLYARPFPFDADVDKITEFFGKHAPVNCVRLRRNIRNSTFKGSVFVEFASAEDMEKVLASTVEFDGAKLYLEKKLDYLERKRNERKEKAEGKTVTPPEGTMDSDGEEADEKATPNGKHKDGEANGHAKGQKRKAEGEADAEDGEGGQEDAAAAEEENVEYESGKLLQFDLEGDCSEVDFRLISDAMGGREVVQFVEYVKGTSKGVLRFFDAEGAKKALEEFDGKAEDEKLLGGLKAKLTLLEGDEEKDYYKRALAQRKKKQEQGGRGGGRGRGFRGRGRGGFRGRGKRGRN